MPGYHKNLHLWFTVYPTDIPTYPISWLQTMQMILLYYSDPAQASSYFQENSFSSLPLVQEMKNKTERNTNANRSPAVLTAKSTEEKYLHSYPIQPITVTSIDPLRYRTNLFLFFEFLLKSCIPSQSDEQVLTKTTQPDNPPRNLDRCWLSDILNS